MVFLGLILAISLVLSFVETLIPSFIPIIGFRIGLSQIGVLLAFKLYSIKEGAFISLGKTILGGLITGTLFTFIFWTSLSGALVALPCLYLGKRLKFSIYSISIMGALGHNLGQLLFVNFTLSTSVVLFYLPYVLIASVLTGALIGYICKLILPFLQKQLGIKKES